MSRPWRGWKGGVVAFALAVSAAVVLAAEGPVGSETNLNAPTQIHTDLADFEWRDAPSLIVARASPAVVVLPNGNILVIGGMTAGGPTATTEIFDVKASMWKLGPSLNTKRVGHTATLLQDGTVLVVGGDTGSGATATAELIDVTITVSTPIPSMNFARSGHSAVLLRNGNVLVTGGTDWIRGIWKQAEIYSAQAHTWSPAGSMSISRIFFSMLVLPDGTALAIGGDANQTSETYNATTNTWSHVSKMASERSYSSSAMVGGKVLVAGGLIGNSLINSSEMFDPMTNSWKLVGSMVSARARFSLAPLPNGDLLAAGSQGPLGTTTSCEIYHPETSSWESSQPMNVSRGSHGYAVVADGSVFVIGGRSGTAVTSSVEAFSPIQVKPHLKPTMPIDLVPLVLAATELPGNSANGLIAKLKAAQAHYDKGEFGTCLNVMNAFYNQVRAFARNGHMHGEHADAIYDGYASVVVGIGGEPLPPFAGTSVAKLKDLAITHR